SAAKPARRRRGRTAGDGRGWTVEGRGSRVESPPSRRWRRAGSWIAETRRGANCSCCAQFVTRVTNCSFCAHFAATAALLGAVTLHAAKNLGLAVEGAGRTWGAPSPRSWRLDAGIWTAP